MKMGFSISMQKREKMHPWIEKLIEDVGPDYDSRVLPSDVTNEDLAALAPHCRHLVLHEAKKTVFAASGVLASCPHETSFRIIEILLFNSRPSLAPS